MHLGVAQAQNKAVVGTANSFDQRLDAKPYAGKAFRLRAQVWLDTTQSGGATVRLLAMTTAAKSKRLLGVFRYDQKALRNREWQTYTVTGRISKKADSLGVVVVYNRNGTFRFDDFALEIEQKPNEWVPVPLKNPGFEESGEIAPDAVPRGWHQFREVQGFSGAVLETAPGQHVYQVQGRGVVPYGRNRQAGRFATANGVKLYYETYGQGEPLLLLHGNGESIVSFSEQIAALAAHYRVIAVDTRGHGQSGNGPARYTYDLFGDDMQALLDTLRLPAAHVVGWSDGANTGLSMALRYPNRVKSLVMMGGNLFADRTAVDAKMLREVRQMQLLSTVLYPFRAQFRRAHRLANLLLRYPRLKPGQLAQVQAPTLVLAGEKDIILEPHTRLIGSSIPGAKVVILPKLTHYAPREDAALFNETVLQFLQPLGSTH